MNDTIANNPRWLWETVAVYRIYESGFCSSKLSELYGLVNLHQRYYDKAIEQTKKTIDMDQTFSQAHYQMAKAHGMKEMYEETIAAAQKAHSFGLPWGTSVLGWAYGLSGKKEKKKELLHELEELSKKRYVSLASIIGLYLGLGDLDRAFEIFEKAYETREPHMPFLNVTPEWDPLRSDPRFRELLKKMNLE